MLRNSDPLTAPYDHALMLRADDPALWLARSRRLAELGRFDKAEADFNKAVELSPRDTDALTARAKFYTDRGDADKAAADFSAAAHYNLGAAAMSDASRKALLALGEQFAGQERWSAAAQVFRRLCDEAGATAGDYRNLAYCELMAHGENAFRACFRDMVSRYSASDNLADQRLVAWTCATIPDALEDLSAAVQAARKAEAAGLSDPMFSTKTLAAILFRAGELEEAIALFDKLLAEDRDNVRGHSLFLLPMAYHAAEREDEARKRLAEGDVWFEQAQKQPERMRWGWRCIVQRFQQEAHRRLEFP